MKFLRYGEVNNEKPAVLDEKGNVRDLSGHVKDISSQTINYILEELIVDKDFNIEELPIVDKANILRIGAPISGVGKFICIGLNYIDHAEESKMARPSEPLVFFKIHKCFMRP
ncbi:hypothetical protein [Francisella halioticida]|uniref:hypothetical protein n=1 Tax=Francisella halioticida TaxID=549298 RepID=UPI001FEAB381|nr:hypothetical protein [Francisella halioticida]